MGVCEWVCVCVCVCVCMCIRTQTFSFQLISGSSQGGSARKASSPGVNFIKLFWQWHSSQIS
jgi:hypothetical protein